MGRGTEVPALGLGEDDHTGAMEVSLKIEIFLKTMKSMIAREIYDFSTISLLSINTLYTESD